MPYPNFHAARIQDPDDFVKIVVLQTLPNGIMIYGGPLKSDPQGSGKPQAYRFPKDKFTVQQAKEWLKDHDIKYIMFEKATENLKYFENKGDGVYEINLKGIVDESINGDDIASEIKHLNETGAKVIKERINSVGGGIVNGFSIISANLNSAAEIHTYNEGMAGSIASLILATGTPGKRFAYDFSLAVIHDPSFDGETLKDIKDEKAKAETQKFKDSLVQIYANNTNMTKWEASRMMTEDVLLNAQEQLSKGLIDKVLPSKMKPSLAKNMSYSEIMNICNDKSKFQNIFNGESSKTAESEPNWGTVDKRKLPSEAYADGRSENASEWSYPHHFIEDGKINEETGRYETGSMYLHKSGLNAAWAAAQGARTGEKADQYIINHLNKHRKDLGLTDNKQILKKMSDLTKFYNLSDEANEAAILKEAQKDRSEKELYKNKVEALEKTGAEKDTEISNLKKEIEKYQNEAIETAVKADISSGKFLAENESSLIENAKKIGLDAYKSFSDNVTPKTVNVLNQIQNTGGEKKSKDQKLGEEWQDLITNNKAEALRIRNEEPAKYEEYVEAWNNLK
jgi:ATP-dependent Clp protease protease subunit